MLIFIGKDLDQCDLSFWQIELFLCLYAHYIPLSDSLSLYLLMPDFIKLSDVTLFISLKAI